MALPPPSRLGRYRILSPNCGLRVSPLQLGAMSLGNVWDFMGPITKEQGFELLDKYYDLGGNFIDTANTYHKGQSEEWIGEWMQKRGNRDEIVLATKYTSNPFNGLVSCCTQKVAVVNLTPARWTSTPSRSTSRATRSSRW